MWLREIEIVIYKIYNSVLGIVFGCLKSIILKKLIQKQFYIDKYENHNAISIKIHHISLNSVSNQDRLIIHQILIYTDQTSKKEKNISTIIHFVIRG